MYKRIREFALSKIKNETALSYFLSFLYKVFSNEIFDAISAILGTVGIALFTASQYYGPWFWITTTTYCIIVVMIALAKRYQREKLHETRLFAQALKGANATLRAWGVELQKCAKDIYNLPQKSQESIKHNVKEINFQSASFVVCENLCRSLTKYFDDENIYVTVYQKFPTTPKSTCKMISYSVDHEPSTYNDVYEVPIYDESLLGKIEYHTYLFSQNKTAISVLHNSESISKHFCWHNKSEEREKQIKQYIAIPIAPAKKGVTFILQVDTNIDGLFGTDKEDVEKIAKTIVYPYAQFLHMVYEEARTIEQLAEAVK